MQKPGEGNPDKADRSDKNGIVVAISVGAVLVVAALLAAAVRIRKNKGR